MFYEWNGYKLRLDAKRVEQLEDALGGRSPLSVFASAQGNQLPALKDLLTILHMALQPLQNGVKKDDVYGIYDAYIENGGSLVEFIKVIVEVYRSSGLIPKEVKEEEVKN